MDALLQSWAQQLATEFANQATTVEELNELSRLMMKSGLERMLDTEMNVHLGRRLAAPVAETAASVAPAGEKKRSPNPPMKNCFPVIGTQRPRRCSELIWLLRRLQRRQRKAWLTSTLCESLTERIWHGLASRPPLLNS